MFQIKRLVLGVFALCANVSVSYAPVTCDVTCGVQCGYNIFVQKAAHKKGLTYERQEELLRHCMQDCMQKCPTQAKKCGLEVSKAFYQPNNTGVLHRVARFFFPIGTH